MTKNMGRVFFILLFCFSLEQINGARRNGAELNYTRKFPAEFKFGVSTAAYQVEGGWVEDGKGMSFWDYHTHINPGIVAYNKNADVAADSYHQYKKDIDCIKFLGVDVYKFTIAWTRILPNGLPHHINSKGVQYYNSLIDGLLDNGVEPYVGIYHWDLPQYLQEKGGLLSPEFPKWFGDYSRILFQHYGDRIKNWVTINEPYIHCWLIYESSEQPPFVRMPGVGYYQCCKNILLAHANAYHIYDKEFRPTQKGSISIDININWPIAKTNSFEDQEAVKDFLAFRMGIFMDPIFKKTGNYPQRLIDRVAAVSAKQGLKQSRLPPLSKAEIEYIKGTSDYLAFNSYTSDIVYRNYTGPWPSPSVEEDWALSSYKNSTWVKSAGDWLWAYAPGFSSVLKYIKDEYDNPPIYIVENGFATLTGLEDDMRVWQLRTYLEAVQDALDYGVNVKGYFVWALLDSFEWTVGYTQRYGLYEVDMEDPERKRTARKSAHVYKEIVRTKTIDYNYNPSPFGRNKAESISSNVFIGLAISCLIFLVN